MPRPLKACSFTLVVSALALGSSLVCPPAGAEPAPPASAGASDAKIQPGQWRTTDTVIEITNPLLSPELVARRKAKPAVVEYCVSSPSLHDMLVGSDKAGLCQGNVDFSGGHVAVTRTCTTGLGKGVRTIAGSWSATRTDTIRDMTQETPKGPSHTKSHVVSERIGDCTLR